MKRSLTATTALFLLVLSSLPAAVAQARADAVRVEVVQTNGGWQLLRAGAPVFIRGAGGSAPLTRLREAGGNSIRTWDTNNLSAVLEQAQKLDLTVCAGLWLRHERDGDNFNYSHPDEVKRQLEIVRQEVLKFKDSPALLVWGLGNEMEDATGDKVEIWQAVNAAARLVKQLDPNHPTMTVIAEMGGNKVVNVHRYCPDIDILGINSYGGGPTVAARYAGLHGTKPYILAEFGPVGPWETGKTPWGAAYEATSTEKAAWYRKTYLGSVAQQPLCLGSYVFLWGQKQETTATWFGMFLQDGAKIGTVDAMTELWTGQVPAQACPAIQQLRLRAKSELVPGETFEAELVASDPNGHPLQVRWLVQPEQTRQLTAGRAENQLPELTTNILQGGLSHAVVQAPAQPGGYRLFVYVRNDAGAAVANVPFHVSARKSAQRATPLREPLAGGPESRAF